MGLVNSKFWLCGTDIHRIPDLKLTSTTGEHGDEQLTFQLPLDRLKLLTARGDARLEHPTFGSYWNGYLGSVTPNLNGCANIVCRGMYKTADDGAFYDSRKFLAGTPAIEMVRTALSKCPRINDGDLLGGLSFQLAEDSPSFGLNAPTHVFEYAQQLTDYLSTPLIWQTRQNPANMVGYPEAVLEFKATDIAPRYRVKLTSKDEFTPSYDFDTMWNVGAVRWGNEQYQLATRNGYSAPELPQNPLVTAQLPEVDYHAIPDVRIKPMDVQGTVGGIREVQQLAGYLVNRNDVIRPAQATLTLDCNTVVESVYPAIVSHNLPHELIRSHFAIEVLNKLDWGIFSITTFYIIGTSFDHETGKVTLSLGDGAQKDVFRLMGSYDVNREYTGAQSSVINLIRRDADVLVQYGMPFPGRTGVDAVNPDDSTMLNNFTTGVVTGISTVDANSRNPKFNDPNSVFQAPSGQSVDPRIIADYGVTCNFGREADSIGIKGFIEVIPCKLLEWYIAFTAPAGSDDIPSSSITVQLYPTYPFTPGTPFATISIATDTDNEGNFTTVTEQHVFPERGRVGVRVSSPNAIAGSGFQIALRGRRLYPVLGLNE